MRLLGWLHRRLVFGRRIRVLSEMLAELLPARGTVLDVGCGDGSLAREIARRRPDLTLRGLDVLIRPRSAIPVEAFDGRTIPYQDGSVDAVLLVDVLHHAHEPERLLGEALRVARDAVVIKDHTRDSFGAGVLLRVMDWVGNAPHGVAMRYDYWPRARWYDAFQRTGASLSAWVDRVGLYPLPLGWLLNRRLHFIARLEGRPERSVHPVRKGGRGG